MRQRFVAVFVASTCFLGLTACSGSNDSERAAVPAQDSSQGDVNSTPGTTPGPTSGTGSIAGPVPGNEPGSGPQDSPNPETGPGPATGPGSSGGPGPSDGPGPDTGQGPQGIPDGPPGSTAPTDIGPPPGSGTAPDAGGPDTVDLEAELQNAASGGQIMDSWVCNGPSGNLDYGFVRGRVRYMDAEGVTDNGTYSITSANSVSVALDTGARHTLTDIVFVPIDNDSINRYFTAQHTDYGAVSCVLT